MLPNWSGRTVVCIASGPSLTPEDCALVRESSCPTIVTNTTFRACPWADALFAYDQSWWKTYIREVQEVFAGGLYSNSVSVRHFGVEWMHQHAAYRSFGNSGACAVSLAIYLGARDIVMLGYDCALTGGPSHHHGDHPPQLKNCHSVGRWPRHFAGLAKHATFMGANVVNASRETALTCFPRVSLSEALA